MMLSITVLEPAVTLTDYALAVECAVFVALIRRPDGGGRWWRTFFVAVGLGALIGGSVHGFFPDGAVSVILWRATLIAIGVSALAGVAIASHLIAPSPMAWMRRVGASLFAIYVLIVLFVANDFVVAIAFYLPASLLLLVAMILAHRREPQRGWALGIVALVLMFAGAAVQQFRVALHPVWFDHNALYHVIQAAALLLLFLAQRRAYSTATITLS